MADRRRHQQHPAVDDVMKLLSSASRDLALVQRHLHREFGSTYPDHANPCKIVSRVKKIQEDIGSLKEQCQGLLQEKQMAKVNNEENNRDKDRDKGKQPYTQWTFEESKELLRLLVEEVKKGQRRENGSFKRDTVTGFILPMLNEKFGGNKEYSHFKNKLRNWRQKIEPVEQVAAYSSKFGWDPVSQKFTAPEDVWEELQKVYPIASSLRNRIFEDYDDLKMVVGNHSAADKDDGILGAGPVNEQAVMVEDDADNVEVERVTPVATPPSPIDATPLNIIHASMNDAPFRSLSKTRKRKAVQDESSSGHHKVERDESSSGHNNTTLDNVVERVANTEGAVQELTLELRTFKQRTTKWLDALNETPGITEEMRWKAYEVMTTPELKDAFVRMPHEERMRWLRYKIGGS